MTRSKPKVSTKTSEVSAPKGWLGYPRKLFDKEKELVNARREKTPSSSSFSKHSEDQQCWSDDVVGLAISGGGIRSATFALGILQSLAKKSLLRRIDFLSTVSGGGYIGSFLGRLYTRDDLTEAVKSARPQSETEENSQPAKVEAILKTPRSAPVYWLRENGRYLAPNGASDIVVAVGNTVRNWITIHLVTFSTIFFLFLSLCALRFCVPETAATLPMANTLKSLYEAVRDLPPTMATEAHRLLWWSPLLNVPIKLVLAICVAFLAMYLVATFGTNGSRNARVRRILTDLFSWSLVWVCVFFAIGFIDTLGQSLVWALAEEGRSNVSRWLAGSLGAAISALAIGASSAKRVIGLFGGEDKKPRGLGILLNVGAPIAALGLTVAYLTVISACAHCVVWGYDYAPAKTPAAQHSQPERMVISQFEDTALLMEGKAKEGRSLADLHIKVNHRRLLFFWSTTLLLTLGLGFSLHVVNMSTYLPLYSARITRTYLGATNPERWKPSGAPITKPLPNEDVDLAEYRPHEKGGPLHIINTTLNETISGQSSIEQHDRKGLNFALGPACMSAGVQHHAFWQSPKNEPLLPPDLESVTHQGLAEPATNQVGIEPVYETEGGFRVFCKKEDGNLARPERLSLGQWVGISGAAFSTGLGYRTNWSLSFLAAFFNVRLGYWWDSGIYRKDRAKISSSTPLSPLRELGATLSQHFPTQALLFCELLARFPGTSRRHWYLSDGGHFENSACYELIRRRIPFIICCDDGADPNYEFFDVSNLVRLARTDFGAEIIFAGSDPKSAVGSLDDVRPHVTDHVKQDADSAPPRYSKAHATLATVKYADTGEESHILFIKPTLSADMRRDILNYAEAHPSFPNESTLDQFFDESQWESYRKLGETIGDSLFETIGDGDSLKCHFVKGKPAPDDEKKKRSTPRRETK